MGRALPKGPATRSRSLAAGQMEKAKAIYGEGSKEPTARHINSPCRYVLGGYQRGLKGDAA